MRRKKTGHSGKWKMIVCTHLPWSVCTYLIWKWYFTYFGHGHDSMKNGLEMMPETLQLLEWVLIDFIIIITIDWKPAIKMLIIFSVPLFLLDSIINAHLWTDYGKTLDREEEIEPTRYTVNCWVIPSNFRMNWIGQFYGRLLSLQCDYIGAHVDVEDFIQPGVLWPFFANVLVSISHHSISPDLIFLLFAHKLTAIEMWHLTAMHSYPMLSAHTPTERVTCFTWCGLWCDIVYDMFRKCFVSLARFMIQWIL